MSSKKGVGPSGQARVNIFAGGFTGSGKARRSCHSGDQRLTPTVARQDCAMTWRMYARFLRMSASNCFEGASVSKFA